MHRSLSSMIGDDYRSVCIANDGILITLLFICRNLRLLILLIFIHPDSLPSILEGRLIHVFMSSLCIRTFTSLKNCRHIIMRDIRLDALKVDHILSHVRKCGK